MNDAELAGKWKALCKKLESTTNTKIASRSQVTQDLVLGLVKQFVDRPVPTQEEGMTRRLRKEMAVHAIIRVAVSADEAAASHPAVANELIEIAKRLCATLPQSDIELTQSHLDTMKADSEIARLCQNN